MFDCEIRDGVCRLARPETRWLSTGWDGGFTDADAAYNVTVPSGWDRRDLDAYVDERLATVGFDDSGPVLLTGVDQTHARGARCGPVEAVATAGVSNPAALPMDPDPDSDSESGSLPTDAEHPPGTVNVLLGTTRALDDAALANLVAVAAEAKATTLLDAVGFPGTTTDAVVVGCDPSGDRSHFSGSATRVGAAARACVREAVRASVESRYPEDETPESVADAEHGVSTDARAEVFDPSERG